MTKNDTYVSLNMESEVVAQVEAIALQTDRTRSAMIRCLINIGLEEYKKRELEKFND